MSEKFARLVMVTADNNNKYYEMTYDGGSNFNVKYGRIKSTAQACSYPISKWNTKYNEKVAKGYVDVTHTVSTTVDTTKDTKSKTDDLQKVEDAKVQEFLSLMKKYTDGLVAKTYTVKYDDVTQTQIDEAQDYINTLMKIDKKDVTLINSTLLKLYMVIPRYMGNVRNHLLPNINIDKVLQQEQDNLDAMASQVAMYTKKDDKKVDKKAKKQTKTLLDLLGIKSMKAAKPGKDVEYLIKQLTGRKIESYFELEKPSEDSRFNTWLAKQKDKTTRILIHGTKCTSVIPILEQGLKIRPTGNYQFSGKAYGDGNYFSEVCSKSLNYTGYDPDKILLVYEVHTGNPYTYDGWYRGNSFTLCYKELQARGFDSTYVKAGNGLLNSEIIAYNEEQSRIKYIIWLK
jgi:poly [ADP-ribose] polymerase 2/3/4